MSSKPFELSFEFFPPKTSKGDENLKSTWEILNELNPSYFSVTFGAGGSTQQKTADTVYRLINAGIDAAPHLSCIGTHKDTIREMLQTYKTNGVKRLVALRGDFPPGAKESQGDFNYANELIEFIRAETGDHFHLEIGAYPEKHPQAPDFETDFHYFAQKAKAGADGAITQYFFDIDAYKKFMDYCDKAKLTIPVTPGIMPIVSFERLVRFSNMCGAVIPQKLHDNFNKIGDDQTAATQYGIEVVTKLCEDLLALGAPGLHFYSLNQVHPTLEIVNRLS